MGVAGWQPVGGKRIALPMIREPDEFLCRNPARFTRFCRSQPRQPL